MWMRLVLCVWCLFYHRTAGGATITQCIIPCNSGGDCIHQDQLCDGLPDCIDGSDETAAVCEQITCPWYSFRCNYGACVASSMVCNGNRDCVDGSDEEKWLCNAHKLRGDCYIWEIQCASGACVPFTKLCDGSYDCLDGDDEDVSLCEGKTNHSAAQAVVHHDFTTTPIMLEMRKEILREENSCVVPLLPNVIVKSLADAVLQGGHRRVPNGTVIRFSCPQDHILKSNHDENICQAPRWLHEFPYCEAPVLFKTYIIVTLTSSLTVVLFILLYRWREYWRPRRADDQFWLVEATNLSD